MSVRDASTTRLKHQAAALVAFAVLGGLACGLLATADTPASAQPTTQTKDKDPVEDPNKVDTRDPLPADTPRRKAMERLQIPDRDRAMFAEIEDFKPVAAESKNAREFDAWIEFVRHAKKQNVRDLDEYAIRSLVPLDFAKMARAKYRTELVRFDGKLTSVRRLVPPKVLRDEVTELYEARFVPLDESPITPMSIVFTELPESLAAVKKKAPEEWLDADGWFTASGYFFKTMNIPGEKANSIVALPLLIGKGLTPLSGPPVGTPTPTALGEKLRIYEFIKDKAAMIRNAPTEATWPEIASYNRVILHASRFSAEELERDANPDLRFADLFEDVRTTHKLECVRFEGHLISLKRYAVTNNEWLTAAGITQLFEGWMIPANEPRGNPICIVFTEPLAGVEPQSAKEPRLLNKWVSFAGYSFKLMKYESGEEDPKDPTKRVEKLAPLLIGRSPIARRDPDEVASTFTWSVFVNGAVAAAALLVLSGAVLTWWYRGGDRKAKAEMDAVRNRNPFDPNANPPAA